MEEGEGEDEDTGISSAASQAPASSPKPPCWSTPTLRGPCIKPSEQLAFRLWSGLSQRARHPTHDWPPARCPTFSLGRAAFLNRREPPRPTSPIPHPIQSPLIRPVLQTKPNQTKQAPPYLSSPRDTASVSGSRKGTAVAWRPVLTFSRQRSPTVIVARFRRSASVLPPTHTIGWGTGLEVSELGGRIEPTELRELLKNFVFVYEKEETSLNLMRTHERVHPMFFQIYRSIILKMSPSYHIPYILITK